MKSLLHVFLSFPHSGGTTTVSPDIITMS